jgi:hypothetical protein
MASDREVQKGFEFLDAMPRYRRVTANAILMSDALHAEAGTPITQEVLRRIFKRIEHQLAVNGEYAEAYRLFFERHPEYTGLECNIAILDATLIKLREGVTAANLEELLLPGNPYCVLDKLAINAAAQESKAEAQRLKEETEHQSRETDRMVGEITGYMLDTNGKVRREFTQRQYNDKIAGLRATQFSDLVARYNTVMAVRAQRKAPVEELRTVVKIDAARQRQALYQRYEQIPDLYFPPGKSEGLKWSFGLFRRLPTSEQRRLLDHFGDAQITAACAARG